jgi:hypothetical protein
MEAPVDEDEANDLYEETFADAKVKPMPPELKERVAVFAEAYAVVEELDVTETIIAIEAAWPIFRQHFEGLENHGRA